MNDEQYMYRCLQLAENGSGTTAPNPLVGAVIVYNNSIIGEGWHQKYGEAHAEINALNDVKDHSLLKQSTLYVNLEPCSHFGKTPPCADAIIKHQLQRVVIGMQDPFNEVNGAGIKKLKDAGIEVTVNVLEDECRLLNRRFITYHTKKRPYILLKWAESADGFIGRIGEKINISNSFSQQLVHKWRSEEAAIMVGAHTLKNDNPQLNVRHWKGKNPVRITFDYDNTADKSLHFFDGSERSMIFTFEKVNDTNNNFYFQLKDKNNLLEEVMHHLYENKIQSVLVEGGAKLLNLFIERNLWDEARVFYSEQLLNHGVKSPSFNNPVFSTQKIDGDTLRYYFNR